MTDTLDRPIIITGAGRSGTKLLRSILASASATVAFPREINYIWRHGNVGFSTDELRPEHARPEVIRYIRKRFARLSRKDSNARVVEKTCANSLRIEFVHAVLPEAHIVHLIRDGRAVAESARRRWQAPPDIGYLWEKLVWVPLADIPYYALRYLCYQAGRLGSGERSQYSWGPRFVGLDKLLAEKTMLEVCGLQWVACVRSAEEALKHLPSDQMTAIRYEDLVNQPLPVAKCLFEKVGLAWGPESRDYLERIVHVGNLDKWRERVSDEDLGRLMPHIETELVHQGYEV